MGRLSRVPVRALLLLAFVILAVRAASRHPSSFVLLQPDVLAAALFLYLPLVSYGRGRPPAWLRVGDLRRNAAAFALLSAVGVLAYCLYAVLPFGPPGPSRPAELPHPGAFLFRQAVFVAAPEEVFFRGYLYDACEEKGLAPVLASSVLFALGHLAIHASPYRALTFFPGLLFGWGRRATGNVYVPVLLHLAFNLLPFWIEVRR